MKTLKSNEKKRIIIQLNEQFEISKLPYLLIKFGKEKLRLYSGSLSREELNVLDKNIRIENAGLYFAKEQKDGIRLTLDGTQILKEQINKNILEIDSKQAKEWLRGEDLLVEEGRKFVILKYDGEFIGCGKSTGDRIINFVPKERRVR